MSFTPGDHVRIRRDPSDHWCSAVVKMISPNGRVIGLMVSGMVRAGGGFVSGSVPIIYDPDSNQFSGLTGDLYTIEKLP